MRAPAPCRQRRADGGAKRLIPRAARSALETSELVVSVDAGALLLGDPFGPIEAVSPSPPLLFSFQDRTCLPGGDRGPAGCPGRADRSVHELATTIFSARPGAVPALWRARELLAEEGGRLGDQEALRQALLGGSAPANRSAAGVGWGYLPLPSYVRSMEWAIDGRKEPLGYYDGDLFPPEHVAPSALVGYAGAMTARGLMASRRVTIKTRELQRAQMWLMDAGGRCRHDWSFDGFRTARAPRVYEEPFQPIQAVPLKYEELAQVYKGVVMPLQTAPQPPWESIARSVIAIESLLSGRPTAYCEVFSRAFAGEGDDGIERTKFAAGELAIVRAISVPFLWEKMAAAGLPYAVADPSAPLLLSAAATLVSGHLQRVRCGRG